MSYDLVIIGSGPPSDVIPAKAGTHASFGRRDVDGRIGLFGGCVPCHGIS